MAKGDKDAGYKAKALRHCIASGMVPYLEVRVNTISELGEQIELVTDLDVLGLLIRDDGRVSRTIFDCKTSRMSPINRALWAAGVLRYVGCNDAFIILERKAVESHKLTATTLDVRLFDESTFDIYAEANNPAYREIAAYSASLPAWSAYKAALSKWPALSEVAHHVNEAVPLAAASHSALRKLIAVLSHARGEFDPARNEHFAIYCFSVSAAMLLLAEVVGDFRNLFDPKEDKPHFESLLRYYIWGGRESYNLRKRIHQSRQSAETIELDLPEWDRFIELVRSLLDAPTNIAQCVLPAHELGFRNLVPFDSSSDSFDHELITRSSRIRQFLFRVSDYIVRAAKLPRDFQERFEAEVNARVAA